MAQFHTDTTPAAAEAQREAVRRLSGSARVAIAMEMSLTARALLAARLAEAHPDWSAARLAKEVLRATLPGGELPADFE